MTSPVEAQLPTPARTASTTLIAGVVLVVATAVAWSNSLSAPFLFDDVAIVSENPSLHSWRTVFFPPRNGMPVTGRPIANLTFAINHAIGGANPFGYHLANIALHTLAGLLLFGIVRRTIRRAGSSSDRRLSLGGEGATVAAAGAALLWMLHPLQTASVTYIAQRTEVLAGFFVLLTLYAFIRGAESSRSALWHTLTLCSCLLGMGSKETAAAVPLIVLLYDRMFIAGSLGEAWRRRWRVHSALASGWVLLAALVSTSANRGGSAGFASSVSWWEYALTQCHAIVHYLHLVIWPRPLVFDYGTPLVHDAVDVWPQILLLVALAGATVYTLIRRSALGFIGACFFLLLAPSSSIVPVATQTMAEHRMYLPLAALALPLVIAVCSRWPGPAVIGVTATAVTVGLLTHQRNTVHRTELALWSDTVRHAPGNPRAHFNLGRAQFLAGMVSDARREFEETLRLDPDHARAHEALASVLASANQTAEALEHLNRSLQLEPRFPAARINRGVLLTRMGRREEAIADYRVAVEVEPDATDARLNLGEALLRAGQPAEAIAELSMVLQKNGISTDLKERIDHALAQAHCSMGLALARSGRWTEAASRFEESIRCDSRFAEAHANLGNVRLQQGRVRDAIFHYQQAIALNPDLPGVKDNLAVARATPGDAPP